MVAFHLSGSTRYTSQAILGFHRFLELFLKDVLRRVDPYLAVKVGQSPRTIFDFLSQTGNADLIPTIEFNEAYNRFKAAFEHYDKSSSVNNEHLKRFEFMLSKENQKTIRILTSWRNRIMHNGSSLPNYIAFEYLISQRLLPILKLIFESDKTTLKGWYPPDYFQTNTGINILDSLIGVKLNHQDLSNKSKFIHFRTSLIHLGHLKELGRASSNHNLLKRHGYNYFEPHSENPNNQMERFVQSETTNSEFHKLLGCVCCGSKTMVVYRRILEYPGSSKYKELLAWAKCYNCDYSMKHIYGDPHIFGLYQEEIFPTS